MKEEYHEKVK